MGFLELIYYGDVLGALLLTLAAFRTFGSINAHRTEVIIFFPEDIPIAG